MIILIIYAFENMLWPELKDIMLTLLDGIGPIVIICLGIALICGYAFFSRLIGAIATGVGDVIIVVIRALFSGIVAFLGWFFGLIPRIYNGVKNWLVRIGRSSEFASFMGVIVSLVTIVIII